jgi:hypothetical protein
MKDRFPHPKLISELDTLHTQLGEVRAEARRLAAIRAATERKLASIGRNLAGLKSQLAAKAGVPKTKSKKT